MRSVARQLQQKTPHTKKTLQSAATRAIVDNYKEKRMEERRRKGVRVRKSRCIDVGMTLENSIKRLSV